MSIISHCSWTEENKSSYEEEKAEAPCTLFDWQMMSKNCNAVHYYAAWFVILKAQGEF